MSIDKLNIHDFRIIQNEALVFCSGVNCFYGDNGSGKTSVLEAINFALTGRSFRTANTKNVIRSQMTKTTIFLATAKVSGVNHKVGIEKGFKSTEVVLDGLSTQSFAEVARLLPLQVVEPSSLNILEASPDTRRRFLDWSVFHVEHAFLGHWRRYKNILKQRNSLLRRGKIDSRELSAWDAQLSLHGEFIHACRVEHLAALQPYLGKYLARFEVSSFEDIQFNYIQGWDRALSLANALATSREGDIERRHTRQGPHRADIRILIEGNPAVEMLSRGQQKIFYICMKMAQSDYLRNRINRSTLFLLDDIGSELDASNLSKVYECLNDLDAQVFVTSIDAIDTTSLNIIRPYAMFHVERGVISQMS